MAKKYLNEQGLARALTGLWARVNQAISTISLTPGPPGAAGQQGSPGAAATIAVGTVTTGAARTNASVTNGGTSGAAVLNFTIPRGATGATGSTGATGNTGATGAAGAKGASFYGWSTASNMTNISSISGMAVGDYVVNNSTGTYTLLGVSTGIGGVVRSTSATAGTAAGNIMGYTPPTSGPLANMTLTQAVAYINQLLNGEQKLITLNVNTVRVVVP